MKSKFYGWVLAVALSGCITGAGVNAWAAPASGGNSTQNIQQIEQEYEEVAWLIAQMNNPANAGSVGSINLAILTILGYKVPVNPADSGVVTKSTWWVEQAQLNTNTMGSPDGGVNNQDNGNDPNGGGSPVSAPESPAPMIIAADLLGLAVLMFVFRGRMLRTQS